MEIATGSRAGAEPPSSGRRGLPLRSPAAWLAVAGLLLGILGLIGFGRPDAEEPADPVAGTVTGRLLPGGDIRFLAIDAAGTVWCRIRNAAGGRDRVVALDVEGRRRDYADLPAAVEANRPAILAVGTLLDFWAVDGASRIWVGPSYFDGRAWTEAGGEALPPGQRPPHASRYDDRVLIDADGIAWLPFAAHTSCPSGGLCRQVGVEAISPAGELVRRLSLDPVPELARLGLPELRLARLSDSSPLLVAGRAAYRLPDATPQVYPDLGVNPETGTRNAGFASALAPRTSGDPDIVTWVEPLAEKPVPRVAELSGPPGAWRSTDLADSPLFAQGTQERFVTAAVYGRDGRLWLASTDGALATREGGQWTQHFHAANSPLGDLIHALAIDAEGGLWVATERGLRLYKEGVWYTSMVLHLPFTDKAFGWLTP